MTAAARLAVALVGLAAFYAPIAARTLPDAAQPAQTAERPAAAAWAAGMTRIEPHRSRPSPRDCNGGPVRWSRAEIACAIRRTFPADPVVATCIAWRESRLEPRAVGRLGERGLFQIHPVHRAWLGARWARLFDPVENARAARDLQRRAGWRPWSTSSACQ
jgi:soluble lytic murein transglycosylase-like protein